MIAGIRVLVLLGHRLLPSQMPSLLKDANCAVGIMVTTTKNNKKENAGVCACAVAFQSSVLFPCLLGALQMAGHPCRRFLFLLRVPKKTAALARPSGGS